MDFDFLFLHTLMGDCFLWLLAAMLLPLLLGLLLGWWLWSKYKKRVDELTAELGALKASYGNLDKDFASLKYQYDEVLKDRDRLKTALNRCESDKAVLSVKLDKLTVVEPVAPLIVTSSAAPVERGGSDYAALLGVDNLQVVEGIGPKIEAILKKAGITSWTVLASASEESLRKILDEAGPSYKIHDPKTWPQQANLAANGHWDELIQFQKFLDTGRENKGDFESPSKLEKLVAKVLGFSNNQEDLKIVEGIGPKIEELLKAAGINTWTVLAATSVDRLKEIIESAGERFRLADPATWPKQAGLAAEGKWNELSEYQEFLDGGKEPG